MAGVGRPGVTLAVILGNVGVLLEYVHAPHVVFSGQNFHEGNKRTALVAGLAFLKMNGYTLDIKDSRLVSVVDKAGMATVTLKEVEAVIQKLVKRVD